MAYNLFYADGLSLTLPAGFLFITHFLTPLARCGDTGLFLGSATYQRAHQCTL